MNPSSDSPRRGRRAFLGIVVIVIVLAAGLSGAWYYLAGRLDAAVDQAIEQARARGTEVGCPNREVFGYPFRIGIRCDAVTLDGPDNGLRASAGALRTAAQIYRPNRVVAELDGPLLLDAATVPPLDIRWSLAQASASFWTEGLDRFSLVSDGPVVALVEPANGRQPLAEATHTETHARRREGNLDLFGVIDSGKLVMPNAPDLPPLDATVDATIGDAADWLAGGARGQSARVLLAGKDIALRSLLIEMGSANAELSGEFAFNDEGRLNGAFELAVADPDEIAKLVGTVAPDLANIAGAIASAVPMAGRQINGRTVIEMRAKDGILSAGIFPIGRIPELR